MKRTIELLVRIKSSTINWLKGDIDITWGLLKFGYRNAVLRIICIATVTLG